MFILKWCQPLCGCHVCICSSTQQELHHFQVTLLQCNLHHLSFLGPVRFRFNTRATYAERWRISRYVLPNTLERKKNYCAAIDTNIFQALAFKLDYIIFSVSVQAVLCFEGIHHDRASSNKVCVHVLMFPIITAMLEHQASDFIRMDYSPCLHLPLDLPKVSPLPSDHSYRHRIMECIHHCRLH